MTVRIWMIKAVLVSAMAVFAAAVIMVLMSRHQQALAQAATVSVCIENGESDWDGKPIRIPFGTVFDWAGPMFGRDLRDPNGDHNGTGPEIHGSHEADYDWPGHDPKHTVAIMTTQSVVVSKASPCNHATARIVTSNRWGWTKTALPEDGRGQYFQVFGFKEGTGLRTDFDDKNGELDFLAGRGMINASASGPMLAGPFSPGDPTQD